FVLDPGTAGGEYTLAVSDDLNRFPRQERKFVVNRYQKPRLNKELDFGRKTYGPGDLVTALCKASRADGGPVAGRRVEVSVTVDDRTYGADGRESPQPLAFHTDAAGMVSLRFQLPQEIEKGLASVAVK